MANCGDGINIPEKTISISNNEKKANRKKIMDFLVNKSGIPNMTKERAAGFCGNIYGESSYNPNAVNPSSKAYGICQWLGDRKKNLKALAALKGKSVGDLDLQLAFLVQEINGSYKKLCWDKVVEADNTVQNATRIILRHYEVPGKTNAEADANTEKDAPTRTQYANKALEAFESGGDVGF
jgi:hypothetical protein